MTHHIHSSRLYQCNRHPPHHHHFPVIKFCFLPRDEQQLRFDSALERDPSLAGRPFGDRFLNVINVHNG